MSETADTLIAIAQAMADELNEAQAEDSPFSQRFTAQRVYDYWRELEETTTLRVDVVPERHEDEPLTRTSWKGEGIVSIAVRQKIKPENLVEVDALTLFVGELRDFWTAPPRRLALFPAATPIKRQVVYPYLPKQLRTPGQFVSVVQLHFLLVSN